MKASVALGAALGVALCAGALAAMQAGAQPIIAAPKRDRSQGSTLTDARGG